MDSLEWLHEQVMFLTSRVHALEKELKEMGHPGPIDNLEAMRDAQLRSRAFDLQQLVETNNEIMDGLKRNGKPEGNHALDKQRADS